MAKTFEEWYAEYDDTKDYDAGMKDAWHARDAEIADLRSRIEAGREQIEAAVMAERKIWQAREQESYRQQLMKRIIDAEKRIEAVRALPEKWNRVCERCALGMPPLKEDAESVADCADELLAALGPVDETKREGQ